MGALFGGGSKQDDSAARAQADAIRQQNELTAKQQAETDKLKAEGQAKQQEEEDRRRRMAAGLIGRRTLFSNDELGYGRSTSLGAS